MNKASDDNGKIIFDGIALDARFKGLLDDLAQKGITTREALRNTALTGFVRSRTYTSAYEEAAFLRDLRVLTAEPATQPAGKTVWDDAIGKKIPVSSLFPDRAVTAALFQAGIETLYDLFRNPGKAFKQSPAHAKEYYEAFQTVRSLPILSLGLIKTGANILLRNGITSIGQLILTGDEYLSLLPGMHPDLMNDIQNALKNLRGVLTHYRKISGSQPQVSDKPDTPDQPKGSPPVTKAAAPSEANYRAFLAKQGNPYADDYVKMLRDLESPGANLGIGKRTLFSESVPASREALEYIRKSLPGTKWNTDKARSILNNFDEFLKTQGPAGSGVTITENEMEKTVRIALEDLCKNHPNGVTASDISKMINDWKNLPPAKISEILDHAAWAWKEWDPKIANYRYTIAISEKTGAVPEPAPLSPETIEQIRRELENLCIKYPHAVFAHKITSKVSGGTSHSQIIAVLDKADWAKKNDDGSYTYIPTESQQPFVINDDAINTIKSVLQKLTEQFPLGVTLSLITGQIKGDPTQEQIRQILDDAPWAVKTDAGFYIYEDTERNTSETDPTFQADEKTIKEIQDVLKKLTKQFPLGVAPSSIGDRIKEPLTPEQVQQVLDEASWADETNEELYIFVEPQDTSVKPEPGFVINDATIKEIRETLEMLTKKFPQGVSISMIAPAVKGNPTGEQILQVLENAKWVKEADNGMYIYDPQKDKPGTDPDSPAAQPRWTEQEAAVLLDAYLKVQEYPEKRKEIVQQVSDQLRQMALNQGMEISDTFRNYAGINFRMYSMETAWTGRESIGHAQSTKMYDYIVNLYRNERPSFDKLLEEARQAIDKTIACNNIIIQKEDYRAFLDSQQVSFYNQVYYTACMKNLAGHYHEYVFGRSIEECRTVLIKIKKNDIHYDLTQSEWKALQFFEQFLTHLETDPSKTIIDPAPGPKTSDPIIPTAVPDEWIIAQLKSRNLQYKDNRAKGGALWILGGHELDDFIEECRQHGYAMWFKTDDGNNFPWQERWGTTSVPKPVEIGPGPSVPDNKQKYRDILTEQFKTGYMPGIMHRKKFKKFWQEKYHEEVPVDDTKLELIIREICIEGEGRYYVPEAMMNKSQRVQLMDYLQKRRDADDKAVALKVVFDDLSEMFVDTEISTPDMLRTWLEHVTKGQFRFEKDFILLQTESRFDPEKEIKNYLFDARVPVHFDRICHDLSHIPADKIKNILNYNTPSLLYNAGNEWFNADILDLTRDDFGKIRSLIDKNLNEQEYVLVKELYNDICSAYSDISDQLAVLSMYGLQNYLKYKLSGSYSFNGQIISSYAQTIDTVKIYRNFARRNVPFTYDDLRELSKDLNTVIYYESTFDSCIRINAKDYVSKDNAHFDIAKTDEILLSICFRAAGVPGTSFYWNNMFINTAEASGFVMPGSRQMSAPGRSSAVHHKSMILKMIWCRFR